MANPNSDAVYENPAQMTGVAPPEGSVQKVYLTKSRFGSSPRIAVENPAVMGEAEFQDFAPCPCVCCGCCVSKALQERTYARVYENRLERNYPVAPCGPCTQEICIIDCVSTLYYDRPPTRSGMCCWCIPITCCGPPVIFSSTPRCLCLDLSGCCGQEIRAAPCNLYGCKICLCCGNPCYTTCSYPLISVTKNSANFENAMKIAVDRYAARQHLPKSHSSKG